MADVIVAKDGENQCQGKNKNTGQCCFTVEPGSAYCKMHNGSLHNAKKAIVGKFHYDFGEHQAEFLALAESPTLKSLHSEIAVLRLTLRRKVARARTPTDFMALEPLIEELTQKIAKTVKICQQVDQATGMYLDKTQVQNLGQEILEIISIHVTDPDTILAIAAAIGTSMERILSQETTHWSGLNGPE